MFEEKTKKALKTWEILCSFIIYHIVIIMIYHISWKREAVLYQIGWFFTHCVNGPWPPPPLGFTQSCCRFFDMNVKKCVNVCRDKIWHNSAEICGQNVKFTLKLWQFYPWKYFFVPILCCQKASRIIQIRNINFYTWGRPPPPFTQCVKIHRFWQKMASLTVSCFVIFSEGCIWLCFMIMVVGWVCLSVML